MADGRVGRRTILIVEDDDDTREMFAFTLTAAGHAVVATADAARAHEIAAAQAPDLVLCDIAMPQVDGYGVLEALRSNPATRRFPVVFLTAHSDFAERVRAFRLGVADFITKPIAPPSLVLRVERILDGLGSAREDPGRPVLEGRLDAVGAAAVLQMCHMLGLTGTLEASDEEGGATIGFLEGRAITARSPGAEGNHAVFDFLRMRRGRFAFVAGPPAPGPEVRDDVAWLVLEGCRLIGERGISA